MKALRGKEINRQQGVALITAILVVALATSAAVAMVSSLHRDIRRSGNLLQHDQALLYAQGVEDWAAQVLRRDREDGEKDTLNEDWATLLPPMTVEGGQISGYIQDLNGRLNINDLVLPPDPEGRQLPNVKMVERFRRLLSALSLNPDLANAVVDWLDKDIDPQYPGGAEDMVYMSHEMPYRTANRLIVTTSELLAIEGFDQEDYVLLAGHITALPPGTRVNVNTATWPVIQSLADGMSEEEAKTLVEQRSEDGYASVDEFLQRDQFAGREIDSESLAIASDYFMVSSHIQVGALQLGFRSLLQRDTKGVVTALQRTQGI